MTDVFKFLIEETVKRNKKLHVAALVVLPAEATYIDSPLAHAYNAYWSKRIRREAVKNMDIDGLPEI